MNVFFTAKTHKAELPFRTIVSERGAWQHNVSQFLLKKLSKLNVEDPFRIKNSSKVSMFVKPAPNVGSVISVDIEDLYYSVPQDKLLQSVKTCIKENGERDFCNFTGMSTDNFLILLESYLKVTFIVFNEQPYLQPQGVCIGSCVAPVLCDISLSGVEKALQQAFKGGCCFKGF